MKPEDTAPQIRRKPDFRSFLEEVRFLRSPTDLKYLFQKVSFLLPRMTGHVDRWTEVPRSLLVEPTLHCNLDCITCCLSKSRRARGNMDLALFRKIIDDAAECGVKRILLFLFGEPLLHPHIVEMIRYVKSKGMPFHLTTNGALCTRELGEAILRSGVTSADYVTFSILGFSKEVHERVMRGVSHEAVLENVRTFVETRRKLGVNGPVVETVFYSIPENEQELKPFLEYWREIVDHAIDGGRAIDAFIDQKLCKTPRTRPCPQLWERMAVHWNGDVAVCGEDVNGEEIVGNLRDQSIREVWSGERLTRIKKFHKAGEYGRIPICEFCDW